MENKIKNGNYRGGKYVDCVICGKSHYRTPCLIKVANGHPCCSVKCAGKWRSKNLVGKKASNYKGKTITKICNTCQGAFKTRFDAKYCSQKCYDKSKWKQAKKQCNMCGDIFSRSRSTFNWHKKRGHKKFFCSVKCKNNYYSGENSSQWIEDRSKLKDRNKTIRWSKKMCLWRDAVYTRDNWTCLLCGARSGKNNPVILNAHHIKPFSKDKGLRFDVENGATLCGECHKLTYWKESDYELLLLNKINIGKEHGPRWSVKEHR